MSYWSTAGQLGITGKEGKYHIVRSSNGSTSIKVNADLDQTFRDEELPVVVASLDALIVSLLRLKSSLTGGV